MLNGNLKLAIQKSGRLTQKSIQLLRTAGLEIEDYNDRLIISVQNFDMDIIYLRDDDIPEYVKDGVADIGIVGENVFYEKKADAEIIRKLGFGKCKFSLAVPENKEVKELKEFNNQRIATSYPNLLGDFLRKNNLNATIVEISGSVETAPSLGIADAICDLVSTGNTLKLHKLKKSFDVFESEAVLIANKSIHKDLKKNPVFEELLFRIDSALKAKSSKYLMMNAPKTSIEKIKGVLPALKSPTILPLADESMVAVHAVIPSEKFWDILRNLKNAGASDILLLTIDNMIL